MNIVFYSDVVKEQVEHFLSGESEIDIFHLPADLVTPHLENESEKMAFDILKQLQPEQFKILMFHSLGSEPALISESLGFTGTAAFWSTLDTAKGNYKSIAGAEPPMESIRNLKHSLDELLESILRFSDEEEKEIEKSKKTGWLIRGSIITIVVLAVGYIFLWNLILPPNGADLYASHLQKPDSLLQSITDSSDFLFQVKELVNADEWKQALLFLEEELGLTEKIKEEAKIVQISLLIRQEQFSKAKELLREFRTQYPHQYRNNFTKLKWHLRFKS